MEPEPRLAKAHPAVALALGERNPRHLGIRLGIERYARAHQPRWRLIYRNGHSHLTWDEAMESAPDAVIAVFGDSAHVEWARARGLTAVNVLDWSSAGRFPTVLPDDPAIGAMAARHLLHRGFEALAFCSHSPRAADSLARFHGFRTELSRSRREPAFFEVGAGGIHASSGLRNWIAGAARPALFCCDDHCAGVLALGCRRLGHRIPDDLGLLGAGDDPRYIENEHVSISSVVLDYPAIGYKAAELLDCLIRGEIPSRTPCLVGPSVVSARESTETTAEPPVVRRLRHTIDQHFRDHQFTPEQAARLCHVTRRTLGRHLRNCGNPGIAAMLRQRRIAAAREIMLVGDTPIERIAEDCGFLDYGTFFRVFRRLCGESPSEWRSRERQP